MKRSYIDAEAAVNADDDKSGDDNDDDDFNVMEILDAQEKEVAACSNTSEYRCTKHILTTSTMVKCLFSRAKLILCEKRSRMTPHHLEMLQFLYCNIFGPLQMCINAPRTHSGVTMRMERTTKRIYLMKMFGSGRIISLARYELACYE